MLKKLFHVSAILASIVFLLSVSSTQAQLPPGNAKGVSMGHIHLLHHLANPVSDERARKLAEELTAVEVTFPGTHMRLIYE